jgi:hypothetical protein
MLHFLADALVSRRQTRRRELARFDRVCETGRRDRVIAFQMENDDDWLPPRSTVIRKGSRL